MSYLVQNEHCRDIIYTWLEDFIKLYHWLCGTKLVKDAFRSTIDEQVAKFLHIIEHNIKN